MSKRLFETLMGSKSAGVIPLDPPDEVVEQLKHIDRMRDEVAAASGVPRGIGGGAIPDTATSLRMQIQHQEAQNKTLREMLQQQAMMQIEPQPTSKQFDQLNNNIERLCHLLETLQLSVLPRD